MRWRGQGIVAITNVIVALLIAAGAFALPTRIWYVDVVAGALAIGFLSSAVALCFNAKWARRLTFGVACAVLTTATIVIVLLLMSFSFLVGVQGELGQGGAIMMLMIVALIFPYLFAYPAALMWWLRRA